MQYTSQIDMRPNYATPRANTIQLAILAAVLVACFSFFLGYMAAETTIAHATAQPSQQHETVNGRFGHFIH